MGSDDDKKKDEKPAAKKEDEEEEDETTGITDPRESDVLCGRGGAALRHPGNQTYRRLVNLNKGLYITCLKTEKLKISRSIVAAIREQRGRFLERNAKEGTWYDIGDKKAIEKTSQALREGQPKLRAKMVEAGQIPPNSQVSMEHQFGNGIYNPNNRPGSGSSQEMMQQMQNQMGGDMPPPPARPGFGSNVSGGDPMSMTSEMMMQRLSLSSLQNAVPSWNSNMGMPTSMNSKMGMPPSMNSKMGMPTSMNSKMGMPTSMTSEGSFRTRMRPSLNTRGSGVADELGMNGPAISIQSQFSAYNSGFQDPKNFMQQQPQQQQQHAQMNGGPVHPGMEINFTPDHMLSQQQQQQFQQNQQQGGYNPPPPPPPPPMGMSPGMSPMMASPSLRSSFDRRRLFAKMKYTKGSTASRGDASQNKSTDGMPDIHMVDSNHSLLSALSNHGVSSHGMSLSKHRSNHDIMGDGLGFSDHKMKDDISVGLGSRRSLMSGLSRISDHSGGGYSVFSDLSKKVGTQNTSTRSIAMSEISGPFRSNDDDFDEDDDGFYSYEYKPKAAASSESPPFPKSAAETSKT